MRLTTFFAAVLLLIGHAAQATTFNFTGEVTSGGIDSGGGTSFGNTGDAVTASIEFLAPTNVAIPVGFTSGGGVNFRINSDNFSYFISFSPDGFNDGFNSSIAVSPTGVFFATSSGGFTWPNEAGNTLRTTFAFDFGTPVSAAPTTYDELIAALSQPGATGTFVTNGDFNFSVLPGQVFDEYRAELRVPTPVVPVPLSGALLLSGLGALAIARRRKG